MTQSRPDLALACSPFLATLVQRQPEWWSALQAGGRLDHDSPPDRARLDELVRDHGLGTGLRQFRNQEMMRIIWRDLNRRARLGETLADLSRLAELCLQAAVETHTAELHERHGIPRDAAGAPQALVVIGMGKLGGRELNLSSDIDLIFCYPQTAACDGPRNLSGEQFFLRLTRSVIRSLSEVTEHGFCFRVDTRLRPFGESGPLVCSFGAMEQYYQREGRDWERYAMVKARPVAGDIESGDMLLGMLRPFVYRRYIDFGAVEALQEMHTTLSKDAADRGRKQDIKRGPGGIREIEFIVQAFQLLRGGREPRLQTPSLFEALDALQDLGVMPATTADQLRGHYVFLRHLENAVQALHDQQTHQLPSGDDLSRIARVMACDSTTALNAELDRVRAEVNGIFRRHLRPDQPAQPDSPWQARWRAMGAAEAPASQVESPSMQRFLERLGRQSLSQRASQRLDRFMPLLLEQLDQRPLPEEVLAEILELVLSITRRSAYLALLVHNPPACARMLDLFDRSAWVAGVVIRHPALLDELIDPTLGQLLPTREEMDANARRILRSHSDPEAVLQALNHMKLAASLRVAVAELETTLSAQEVQQTLTELAETLLGAVLRLAREEVCARHELTAPDELCVIGYGSLGAGELSYESDLDLIFLHERAPLPPTADDTSQERFHTQVARRLLSLLTVSTSSGRLYATDTRLRPNGRAGLLVSSLGAFENYQHAHAWIWELQALTRARPVAGNQAVAEQFLRIRREVLCTPRDTKEVRAQVTKMRRRMRAEFSDGDALKHGQGGLVDIGFLAQLGVLECAPAHPGVLEATNTTAQLQGLALAGWLSQAQAHTLCAAHESLSRARQLASIARNIGPDAQGTSACAAVCTQLLGAHAAEWFSHDSGPDDRLPTAPGEHHSG